MEDPYIADSVKETVKSRLAHFEQVSDHIYVDSNTILKAVFALDEIKTVEDFLERETGKKFFYAKYKAAKETIDEIFAAGENARTKLRSKIYGWLMQGNECEHASLRKDGYEVEITNENLVPREFLKVDDKLIAEQAKELDGNIRIPGVIIKPKRTLVVKIKDKK